MSIHKVLVTGACGQLGNALVKQLLIAGYNVVPMDRKRCDVRMLEEVYQIFTKEKPDVVIHAAAYTNVDAAEENMDDAYAVNTYGTRNVAIAAKDVGARLVYVSTDFVFEGNQTKPYSELIKQIHLQYTGNLNSPVSRWLPIFILVLIRFVRRGYMEKMAIIL